MLQSHRRRARRGLTLVETAFILTIFITLIFGMIDLGAFVYRLHAVNQAARKGARQAIVQGSLAKSTLNGGPWGPTTYGPVSASANGTDPQVLAILPSLSGIDPSTVQVTYAWPDASNVAEKRVGVTVSATWTPTVGMIFGAAARTVSATSTMQIAH